MSAYVGVGNLACKVKSIYVGVGDLARKVKKGYIGIGGVARPFFGMEGELEYYGTITPLSQARSELAATTVGNYALFAGGTYEKKSDKVDVYQSNLAKSNNLSLRNAVSLLSATTVDNYALFAGGVEYRGRPWGAVNAFNNSLVRVNVESDLTVDRYNLAATTAGNYALFAGGYGGDDPDTYHVENEVNSYNSSLVRGHPARLSSERQKLAATTVGGYALFAGGCNRNGNTFYSTVDYYNTSLTRSTATSLRTGRYSLAATSVGDYALFAGGIDNSPCDEVDIFNRNLVITSPTAVLLRPRFGLAATTVGDYAVFGGGGGGYLNLGNYNQIDIYNTNLMHDTGMSLSDYRRDLAATTVGNYALFGGGSFSENFKNTVDAYVVT